ncbi:MAG: hypothetical protein ACFB15_11120 [Cyclobacteriaceae bacterium]
MSRVQHLKRQYLFALPFNYLYVVTVQSRTVGTRIYFRGYIKKTSSGKSILSFLPIVIIDRETCAKESYFADEIFI